MRDGFLVEFLGRFSTRFLMLISVIVSQLVGPFVGPQLVLAQQTPAQSPTGDSTLYIKAQQMINNGATTAGRALIDSLLNTAPAGSPQYAEALYWHATLAASASAAERDYRRIVVDYPLSPRVDDALLRMGQLELTRGDADAALLHFQRLTTEHLDSPLRAKANYWMARALFEKNDASHACAANAEALARVQPADVELKNQIDYQNQRCRGVATIHATSPSSDGRTAVVRASPTQKSSSTPASVPTPPRPSVPILKSVSPVVVNTTHAVDKGVNNDAKLLVLPETSVDSYAIQVAAYYDRPQADALAAKLRSRGYQAHVDGIVAPFRVRIGHFPSHTAAATMLAKLQAKKITGFVTKG